MYNNSNFNNDDTIEGHSKAIQCNKHNKYHYLLIRYIILYFCILSNRMLLAMDYLSTSLEFIMKDNTQ